MDSHAKIKVYSILMAIFVVSLGMSSCIPGKKNNPMSDVALYGSKISKLSEQTLNEIYDLDKNQDYHQEYIKIVNDISPETYIMNFEPNIDDQMQMIYKINAFNNLDAVFSASKLQFDAKVSESAATLRSKIFSCCNSLDSINMNDDIKLRSNLLKKNIKNTKFSIENGIYELSNIFYVFWQEESMKQVKKMLILQEERAKGIKQIPAKAFDIQKLKEMVSDPYDNDYVLANLYKLRLIKANQEKFSVIENKMKTIFESFGMIVDIQSEMMKRRKDLSKIENHKIKLDILLNDADKVN